MNKNTKDENEYMKVYQLRPPKLKDRPLNRSRIVINLKEQFGFVPEIMFIDKVQGKHDRLIISAVLPKEMESRFEKDFEKGKAPEGANPNAPKGKNNNSKKLKESQDENNKTSKRSDDK